MAALPSNSPLTYLESLDLMQAIHELVTQGDAVIANTRTQIAQQKASHQQTLDRQRANAEEQMRRLVASHNNQRAEFERECEKAITDIYDQAKRTASDASDILAQLESMDSRLESRDRWYRSYRRKNIDRVEGTVDQSYKSGDDVYEVFAAMQRIRDEFEIVSEKYRTRMWPAVIDGIHYLLSTDRHEDYEKLLTLKYTIKVFHASIKDTISDMAKDAVAKLRNEQTAKREQLENRITKEHKKRKAELDRRVASVGGGVDENRAFENLANRLDDMMLKALPRQLVARAERTLRIVNELYGTPHVDFQPKEGVLYAHAFVYPLQSVCKEPALCQMIESGCGELAANGSIYIPFAATTKSYVSPYASMVSGDVGLNLALSAMYSIIGNVGVGRLRVSACDVEGHGSSLQRFYGMRTKVPEVFDGEFLTNEPAVSNRIAELGEYVETTTQQVLGSGYANIWDYANAHSDANPEIELLVLLDYPAGVDERSISVLRNIIVQGPVCGVYAIICESADQYDDDSRMAALSAKLKDVCNAVDCGANGPSMLGMRYVHPNLPSNAEMQRFVSRYMLALARIRNQGIGFPAYLQDLVSSKSQADTARAIRRISAMMHEQSERFGVVPSIDMPFPSGIPLGFTHYPADVFDGVPGCRSILKAFGDGRGAAKLPLMLDFERSGSILAEYDSNQYKEAEQLAHFVIWSFLSNLPPTKLNVCVVDMEKKGMGIAPFLDFRKACPEVFDGSVHTNSSEVRERLMKLESAIDTTIQDKLGARYANLLEYNRALSSNAEPFTLLIVNDFPMGFDSMLASTLANIVKNGARCGVYAVISCNRSIVPSGYDDYDSLKNLVLPHCEHIDFRGGAKLMPYELSVSFGNTRLTPNMADAFARDYGVACTEAQNRGLSFADVADKELFGGNAAEALEIPIGIADGGAVAHLDIGRGSSHHALIAGATGSGKSTLLHTIIMSAITRYSPDQLHLYLMDFKSGTEFKVYDERHLPHVRLLALDAMQEFGESILENLVAEMQQRSEKFKQTGVSKLADYIERAGTSMPRILVIMDEFQVLFNDRTNREVANHCAELTKKIVTEGRSYGVHLIMATQSMRDLINLSLSSGTIEQMRIRIGLKCGERDCVSLFGDENSSSALSGMAGPKGTAVMNLEFTQEENTRLRVSYCKPKDQLEQLDRIARATAKTPCKRRTFEGSRTPELIEFLPEVVSESATSRFPKVLVGEPIKVAPPLQVSFDRRRRHNTVICGANPTVAEMLANLYVLQSALHPTTEVWCVDGEHLNGEGYSEDLYECMKARFENFHVPESRGEIIQMVHSLGDSLSQRRRGSDPTNVVVVMKSLQFLDIVCSMMRGEHIDESQYVAQVPEPEPQPLGNEDGGMVDFGLDAFVAKGKSMRVTTTQDASAQLIQLMSEGGVYGIHFVITAMDFQTIKDSMYFNENLLSKFPERLAFSLRDADCDRLVEGVSVEELPENIVVYTDSTKNTYQVKPFTFPGVDAIDDCLNGMKGV